MFKNSSYEWWIASRYTLAGRGKKRGDRFISFISASSMLGIALGVAALIIVLSVMNGFQKEVRDRMLSVLPHIEIFDFVDDYGKSLDALQDWQKLLAQAKTVPGVEGGAPYVSSQGMIAFGNAMSGVQVRGVDPRYEGQVSELPQQLKEGRLEDLKSGTFGVIIGRQLAQTLEAGVGDAVLLMAPQGSVSPAGFTPRMRQLRIVGIFDTGYFEYDASLVFLNVDDAAKLFQEGAISGLRVRTNDMLNAPTLTEQIARVMPSSVYVRDWTTSNRTWFQAVQTEKFMMFLILALIVGVAAFNLLSSLVMVVKDKQSDIAILRTLGAPPRAIAKIFMYQGAMIGVFGTFLGVSVGTLVALNIDVIVPFIEWVLGAKFIRGDVYFIDHLPSDVRAFDVMMVTIISLVLSLLATIYPSWRASRLQPAEVLRHD